MVSAIVISTVGVYVIWGGQLNSLDFYLVYCGECGCVDVSVC